MFGALRLILSYLVVASHVEIPHAIDMGSSAVVVFFLLSGYVMTATIRRYYSALREYKLFLIERAARIFPQYLFWVLACVGWIAVFDRGWLPVTPQIVAENIALIPGMYGVFDLRPFLTGIRYVTQTWSLSLEWHFYMLLPFIVIIPHLRAIAFTVSIFIFTLATFGIISPYLFSFHLLPGVLFIFLIGSVIFDERARNAIVPRLWLPLSVLLILGIVSNTLRPLQYGYLAELYIGIFIGLPVVWCLAHIESNRIDMFLGNLSYGVFLCHNLVLEILSKVGGLHSVWWILFFACLISTVFSGISYMLVERPLVRWRHSMRKRAQKSELKAFSVNHP